MVGRSSDMDDCLGYLQWSRICIPMWGHVSIDVLVDFFPRKIQTIIDWFGFFCTFAMLIYVGFYGFKLNVQFLDMGKMTSILKIPSYKIYWIVPIGCIWMMMSYAYYMAGKYFLHTSPGEPEMEGTQ